MHLKIMIVEDERLIAMDLEDILEGEGHVVVGVAADMYGALEIAAENPGMDLAIMDIDLARGTSGIDTARLLREDYDVGSLFVSGRISEETHAMALEWKPIGFVGKPFAGTQIIKALSGVRTR
ncbi:response regulator [Aureimonas frigidaquae]|uniref:response regulator n=1 Tax=Aureimonas frigidaquae TaxID=424757 RepID=UPI00078311D0|nr:response regulator [Aureimonas frigidaquae]